LQAFVEHVRDRAAEPLGVGVDEGEVEVLLEVNVARAALGPLRSRRG